MHLPPAEALVLNTAAGGTTLISGRGLLKGWSMRNQSASAISTVKLHDGSSANGNFLFSRVFAAQEGISDWFSEMGIIFLRGIFFDVAGQPCDGALYVIPETRLPDGWDEIGGWSGD